MGRSKRSFNNWLFDYIKEKPMNSKLKHNGILYLLLSFEDVSDFDSISVCSTVFHEDISNSHRLYKIISRNENK